MTLFLIVDIVRFVFCNERIIKIWFAQGATRSEPLVESEVKKLLSLTLVGEIGCKIQVIVI
jgi:hypothetical protein